MKIAIFSIVFASLVISNVFLGFSILKPNLRIWPPPEPGAPQYKISKINRLLSSISVVGVFLIGVIDLSSIQLSPITRFALGLPLFAAGGAFALWGFFGLGLRASQGEYEGLIASGAYRYSRNPQYVGTILCVFGYALATASIQVFVLWGLWTLWFLLAPFSEEPWMRAWLGDAYEDYAARVPRYLRLRPPAAPFV